MFPPAPYSIHPWWLAAVIAVVVVVLVWIVAGQAFLERRYRDELSRDGLAGAAPRRARNTAASAHTCDD